MYNQLNSKAEDKYEEQLCLCPIRKIKEAKKLLFVSIKLG